MRPERPLFHYERVELSIAGERLDTRIPLDGRRAAPPRADPRADDRAGPDSPPAAHLSTASQTAQSEAIRPISARRMAWAAISVPRTAVTVAYGVLPSLCQRPPAAIIRW